MSTLCACLPYVGRSFGPCFRLGDARPESPVERIDMYMYCTHTTPHHSSNWHAFFTAAYRDIELIRKHTLEQNRSCNDSVIDNHRCLIRVFIYLFYHDHSFHSRAPSPNTHHDNHRAARLPLKLQPPASPPPLPPRRRHQRPNLPLPNPCPPRSAPPPIPPLFRRRPVPLPVPRSRCHRRL